MTPTRLPALFVSDFGPFPAVEDDDYTRDLAKLGEILPRPKAIVIASGHWQSSGAIRVTSAAKPETIHDYSGFPESFYQLSYPCPGDPALADKIVKRLINAQIPAEVDARHGLDHGSWVPLSRIYSKADIPVIQIALPANNPQKTAAIGRALSDFRDEGVLLVGSGALSHNLRLAFTHQKNDSPDAWAVELDDWIQSRLSDGPLTQDWLDYHKRAPHAALAAPTDEHFDPIFFVLGARNPEEKLVHIHRSIRFGNGLMRLFYFTAEEQPVNPVKSC